MESARTELQIMILDACRNNPFGRGRGASRGLAPMNAGRGAFVAYATAPGQTADDNAVGRNGLYTTHLLESLRQPGLKLEEVFKTTGAAVQQASGGRQVPWTASSVAGDFYFRVTVTVEIARPPPQPPQEPLPAPNLQLGVVYRWEANKLVSLERGTAIAKSKSRMLGFAGGRSWAEISGDRSPVRVKAGQAVEFVVGGVDPSRYKLYRLTSKNGKREMVILEQGLVSSKVVMERSEVPTNISTFLASSARIVPTQPLAPGEYSFSPVGVNDVFCFGVDPASPPKAHP